MCACIYVDTDLWEYTWKPKSMPCASLQGSPFSSSASPDPQRSQVSVKNLKPVLKLFIHWRISPPLQYSPVWMATAQSGWPLPPCLPPPRGDCPRTVVMSARIPSSRCRFQCQDASLQPQLEQITTSQVYTKTKALENKPSGSPFQKQRIPKHNRIFLI